MKEKYYFYLLSVTTAISTEVRHAIISMVGFCRSFYWFLYRYRVGGYTEIKQRRMDGQVCVKLREKAMRIIETLEVLPPCLWEIKTYQPTDGYTR